MTVDVLHYTQIQNKSIYHCNLPFAVYEASRSFELQQTSCCLYSPVFPTLFQLLHPEPWLPLWQYPKKRCTVSIYKQATEKKSQRERGEREREGKRKRMRERTTKGLSSKKSLRHMMAF